MRNPWPVSSTIPTPTFESAPKFERFSTQTVSTGFAVSSKDGLWIHIPKRFKPAADVIEAAMNGDWARAQAALDVYRGI